MLLVLSPGGLQAAAGGSIAGFLLTMTGNERAGAVIIGAAAAVYLVLVAILAPLYGAIGVALATVTSFLFAHLARLYGARSWGCRCGSGTGVTVTAGPWRDGGTARRR